MLDRIKRLIQEYEQMTRTKLYQERNYEEAQEYAIRAIQCAELVDDWRSIIANRLLLGHIYLNSMINLNYAATIYLDILDSLDDYEAKGLQDKKSYYFAAKYALARTFRKLGKIDQAIPLLEEAEKNIQDVRRRISVLNDLGLTYWEKALKTKNEIYLDEAVRVYDLALKSCNEDGSLDNSKAMVLNNKGMVYYAKHLYDPAIEAFNEALLLTDDEYYIACISNEIAKTYIKIENFHKAKQFINKANQILIDYDEKVGEAELLRNVAIEGLYQRKMGNFEDAVKYFEMAASQLEDRELKIEAAETFHQMSIMLKEKNDIRSGRYALKFEELAKEIEEQ